MRVMDDSWQTDGALTAAVAAGDQAGFRLLVERHYARALALAGRILIDRAAAEDVVQESFLRYWRRPHMYDDARGSFSGWLRRVVVNLALDRRRMIRPAEDLDAASEHASAAPDPEEEAMASSRAARINAAMATLPARQRAALALFYGEGMTMAEVAATMETQPKAVESLLSRGRAQLRALLTPLKEAL